MKAARAGPGLRCGTCEPVVPRSRAASGAVLACGCSRKGDPQAADAGASRAEVHLRYWPDELEIEVTDDGRGNAVRSSTPGGLGLIGMRERVSLHGGQITAGPAAGGGFSVRVRLPTPAGVL